MNTIDDNEFSISLDALKGIAFKKGHISAWGRCEINIDPAGQVTAVLENCFLDRELIFGQISIVARDLAIDLDKLKTIIRVDRQLHSAAHRSIVLPSMLEDLRALCAFVNDCLINLAVTHLGADKESCQVHNGHVISLFASSSQFIPYKLLIALELNKHSKIITQTQIL